MASTFQKVPYFYTCIAISEFIVRNFTDLLMGCTTFTVEAFSVLIYSVWPDVPYSAAQLTSYVATYKNFTSLSQCS